MKVTNDQFLALLNRIEKRFKYLNKWAAKNNIEYELKDLDGLALQCISSDLVENYTNYRPNVIDPNTQ